MSKPMVPKIDPEFQDGGWNVYVIRDLGSYYEYRSRRKMTEAQLLWRHQRRLKFRSKGIQPRKKNEIHKEAQFCP